MRQYTRLFALLALLSLLFSSVHAVSGKAKTADPFHYQNKVIVLLYHHFADKEQGETISAERFRSHLQALKDCGYRIITMEQFLMFKLYHAKVPDNAVLLTMDDGYESVYRIAFPVLRKFRETASTFVIVQSTDQPMEHGEHFPHLTWDEMKEMKKDGMSFYSHTFGLHVLVPADDAGHQMPALTTRIYDPETKRTESEEAYETRVKTDLELADKRLDEELGVQDRLLSFPFGKFDDNVIRIGEESGVKLFFTTKAGINEDDGSVTVNRINAGVSGLSGQGLLKKLRTYDEVRK